MSYYPPPPPDQGNNFSVGYYPPPNQGYGPGPYGNAPSGDYNRPIPFPIEPPGMMSPPTGYPMPMQGYDQGYGNLNKIFQFEFTVFINWVIYCRLLVTLHKDLSHSVVLALIHIKAVRVITQSGLTSIKII